MGCYRAPCQQAIERGLAVINAHLGKLDAEALVKHKIKIPAGYKIVPDGDRARFEAVARLRPIEQALAIAEGSEDFEAAERLTQDLQKPAESDEEIRASLKQEAAERHARKQRSVPRVRINIDPRVKQLAKQRDRRELWDKFDQGDRWAAIQLGVPLPEGTGN